MLNVVFRGKKIFILWKQAQKNECGRKFNNRIKVAQHHNLESFYQGISFMMSMQSFIFCPMSDMSFEIVMPYIQLYGVCFSFFLFVCFCINSYIHLGEKRVRPSSQTQLGLDSWIQKFLPFHGLFIIIFRIYSVYYENYKDEIMLQVSIQVQLCCIVVTCRKPEQNRKRHYHQYFHQLP